MTKYDLIGQRFGKLVVIERAIKPDRLKSRGIYWQCICDCGNKKVIITSALVSGKTKSCGCLIGKWSKEIGLASFNATYNDYIYSSKEREIDFFITKEEFKMLTSKNCYYCERPPSSHRTKKETYNGDYIYNGLDRVDNSKPYILDNVVPCCKICNYAKGNMSVDEFFKWIISVYKHNSLESFEESK